LFRGSTAVDPHEAFTLNGFTLKCSADQLQSIRRTLYFEPVYREAFQMASNYSLEAFALKRCADRLQLYFEPVYFEVICGSTAVDPRKVYVEGFTLKYLL
jgi:hypothetical protein